MEVHLKGSRIQICSFSFSDTCKTPILYNALDVLVTFWFNIFMVMVRVFTLLCKPKHHKKHFLTNVASLQWSSMTYVFRIAPDFLLYHYRYDTHTFRTHIQSGKVIILFNLSIYTFTFWVIPMERGSVLFVQILYSRLVLLLSVSWFCRIGNKQQYYNVYHTRICFFLMFFY